MKDIFDRLGDLAEARMPVSWAVALAAVTVSGCILLAYSWGIR